MFLANCAAAFCIVATGIHLTSVTIASWRCRRRPAAKLPTEAPGVTILRPVCGTDPYVTETLQSSFRLDYLKYEVIFCAAREDDPAVPIVRQLIAANRQIP